MNIRYVTIILTGRLTNEVRMQDMYLIGQYIKMPYTYQMYDYLSSSITFFLSTQVPATMSTNCAAFDGCILNT